MTALQYTLFGGSAVDVVPEGVRLHRWGLGFSRSSFTISRGSCRTTHRTRLPLSPAFPACYGPRWLSPPGKPGDPRVFLPSLPVCDRVPAFGVGAHRPCVNRFLGCLVRLARRLLTREASGVVVGRKFASPLTPMVIFAAGAVAFCHRMT